MKITTLSADEAMRCILFVPIRKIGMECMSLSMMKAEMLFRIQAAPLRYTQIISVIWMLHQTKQVQ